MSEFRVIASSGAWVLSGVNTFVTNLVRGLRARGVDAEVLLTSRQPAAGPPDIELRRLPVAADAPLPRRWSALVAYLEERAPCVFVPNCDPMSVVSPKLSRRVAVVGVVHSDDPIHYEQVRWLGKYWDAVVAGSKAVEEGVAHLDPSLRPRLSRVQYGTPIPALCPGREVGDPTLRVVFASRLAQYQKRVLDLPAIAEALTARGVPFRLTVLGAGEDQDRLQAGLRPFLADGRAVFKGVVAGPDFPDELQRHDVFLLTSDFEGMPIALLDAMGRGCVPVVTDIASGIPELVQDGVNGYRVPVGDAAAFADRLAALQRDVELRRRFAARAHATVASGGFRVEDMAEGYLRVFRRAVSDAASGAFRRPAGRIRLLPSQRAMTPTWKDWLPEPVRGVGGRCRRALGWLWSALFSAPV
jgi:glycosyltransferase involved in cell wall biosynthesis